MTFYPKQPFGPSAPGAAGVRALDIAGGGAFQRKWTDTSTRALLQGDFRKVITGAFKYIASGYIENALTLKYVAAVVHQAPFVPWLRIRAAISLGAGVYAGLRTQTTFPPRVSYNYEPLPGVVQAVEFAREAVFTTMRYATFYGGLTERGGLPRHTTTLYSPGSGGINFPGAALSFVGNINGEKVTQVALAVLNGRQDASGRPIEDMVWAHFFSKKPAEAYVLDTALFTRSDAWFSPWVRLVAVGTRSAIIFYENFFAPGPVEAGRNYQPKFWMAVAPGNDLTNVQTYDITTSVYDNNFLPAPTPAGVDAFGAPFPAHYLPSAGNLRNVRADIGSSGANHIVTTGSKFLLTFLQHCNGATPETPRWHFKTVVIDLETIAVNVTLDHVFGPSDELYYFADMIHLGEGWVLAKKVLKSPDNPSDNIDIEFVRSTNGGETWTTIAPTGFGAPLKNRFFGGFTIDKARVDNEPGVVLLNAWDIDEAAPYVWESKDDGNTWVRRGRIAKPVAPFRMDSGFGGLGSFGYLLPGPDPSRPVDLTMPARFN